MIEFTNKPNESETADTIAEYVQDTSEKSGLYKKCATFTGDNCNTMFGGLRRNKHGNNVVERLKKTLNTSSRLSSTCLKQLYPSWSWANEHTINKIYQYFSINTVQAEQLKGYCEFADVKYRKFLSHSKTSCLSLFPGITRVILLQPVAQPYGQVHTDWNQGCIIDCSENCIIDRLGTNRSHVHTAFYVTRDSIFTPFVECICIFLLVFLCMYLRSRRTLLALFSSVVPWASYRLADPLTVFCDMFAAV